MENSFHNIYEKQKFAIRIKKELIMDTKRERIVFLPNLFNFYSDAFLWERDSNEDLSVLQMTSCWWLTHEKNCRNLKPSYKSQTFETFTYNFRIRNNTKWTVYLQIDIIYPANIRSKVIQETYLAIIVEGNRSCSKKISFEGNKYKGQKPHKIYMQTQKHKNITL